MCIGRVGSPGGHLILRPWKSVADYFKIRTGDVQYAGIRPIDPITRESLSGGTLCAGKLAQYQGAA